MALRRQVSTSPSTAVARAAALLGVLLSVGAAGAVDHPIPAKVTVVKPSKLAKLVAKSVPPQLFPTPASGGSSDPTLHGAVLRVFDRAPAGAGDFTHALPAAGWTGLGNPAGAKGYIYKGGDVGDAVCKVVVIKETLVKAICKNASIPLTPPFIAPQGILLGIPDVSTGAALRYCTEFSNLVPPATKNDAKTFKAKDAPAPPECPASLPTPSVTTTPTQAATPTASATSTSSATAAATSTASQTMTASQTHTSTATPTVTQTPSITTTASASASATATPTMGSSVCGNGFLEPGETCATCAADCVISPCTPLLTPTPSFTVLLSYPLGAQPTTATVLVGYRSNRVSIPGTGSVTSVRQRVTYPPPPPNPQTPNDLDYAIRLVIGRASGMPAGLLATIRFDRCQGTPAPTVADFGCTVEALAGVGGSIEGGTCTIGTP